MKYIISLLAAVLVLVSGAHAQNTLAKWTFETLTISATYTNGAGAITNVPADVGSGTASGSHATLAIYSTPAGNGSTKALSSDHWSVNDSYQFAVSTVGYG